MKTKESIQNIIKRDIDEIYLGNLSTVETNLILPSHGKHGSIFSWKSGEDRFISNSGKVNRPVFGAENRKVNLTVTATYLGETISKTYLVTVLEEDPETHVVNILPTNLNMYSFDINKLPSVVIVKLNDNTYTTKEVQWDIENLQETNTSKIFLITGNIENFEEKAICTIHLYSKEKKYFNYSSIKENYNKYIPLDIKLINGSRHFDVQQNMLQFLLSVDDDQMLYNFRLEAGLDTKGAPPMIGWDAPESKLKGHTTGHYLSALSLAYRATENEKLLLKINYIVDELEIVQKKFSNAKNYSQGFLSAYSELQFDELEKYTRYPEIWAPYYTLDKIMSGLLDAAEYSSNKKALQICDQIGKWMFNRLDKLSKSKREKMWSIYIAGEYGGITLSLTRLFNLTKNPIHLKCSTYFNNDKLFFPMFENVDVLKSMHANQHIPQIVGSISMFLSGEESKYYDIAYNFWEMVINNHIYSIGGTGETEMFRGVNEIGKFLTEKSAESCASYNMLKLTSFLFKTNENSKYMDYFERTYENHTLSATCHDTSGATTYFMPTSLNGQKEFDTDENSCCHGTGMESPFKFQENIYLARDNTCFINLFIPSKMTWKEKSFSLIQNLNNNSIEIKIIEGKNIDLYLRIPNWSDNTSISINNRLIDLNVKPNGYAYLGNSWENEDIISIKFSYKYYLRPTKDIPNYATIFYGPYALAAIGEMDSMPTIDLHNKNLNKQIIKKDDLIFTMNEYTLKPLNQINMEKYNLYFNIV